jgi:hypothetical protein
MAFGNTVEIFMFPPLQSAATNLLTQRMIVSFEPSFLRDGPELTHKPDSANLLKPKILVEPTESFSPCCPSFYTQRSSGFPRNWVQKT